MNILFLAYFPFEPSVGGIQRVTDILAHELIRRGHIVNYLSIQLGPTASNLKTAAPQYYIDVKNTENWAKKIKDLFVTLKVEYIINQTPNSFTYNVLKELDLNVKLVSVFHTQPFFNDNTSRKQILLAKTLNFKHVCFKWFTFFFPKIRSYVFGYYEKNNIIQASKISDKVCFISERFYPRIMKHIPDFPKDKLCAINNPNAFDICECSQHKENLLAWVGRVENSIKNTIGFVKVWEHLYKKNPRWRAVVAGDGDDIYKIKEYVHKHSIKNIEFIGRCDDIQSLYKRAKFIVVTSYSESWCMALTEGLAHSCVACAFNTYESVHDIITEDNGIITKPNPKEMANQLHYLMNNKEQYQKLSSHAASSIKDYNIESTLNKWIELLLSIKK